MHSLSLSKWEAEQLEKYISDHITYCWEYLAYSSVDEYEGEIYFPPEFEPFGPYCGCSTCETREYMMAMVTWLRENNKIDIFVE